MRALRTTPYAVVIGALVGQLACQSRDSATAPSASRARDAGAQHATHESYPSGEAGRSEPAPANSNTLLEPAYDSDASRPSLPQNTTTPDANVAAEKHCPEVPCPPERPTCAAGHCICVPTCHKGLGGCCGPDGCGGWVGCPSGQICLWPQNRCADVQADCQDGWCKIPAGSVWLSDQTRFVVVERFTGKFEWKKRPEELRYPEFPVLLTYTYLMQQTPMTCGQIAALIGQPLSYCHGRGSECPVIAMTYMGALWVANLLSQSEGLEQCYILQNCVGDPLLPTYDDDNWRFSDPPSKAFHCERAWFKGKDCEGYRIPTWAEWMYALRAGELGVFWYGIEPDLSLPPLSNKQPFAPYFDFMPSACASPTPCRLPDDTNICSLHPVASFLPNPFGLYDLLFRYAHMVQGVGPVRTSPNALIVDPNGSASWIDNLDFALPWGVIPELPRPTRWFTHFASAEWERTRASPGPMGVPLRFVRTIRQEAPPPTHPFYLRAFPPEPRWLMGGPWAPPPESYCYLPKLGWSLCCWAPEGHSLTTPNFATTVDAIEAFEPDLLAGYDLDLIQCNGDKVLDPDPFDLLPDVP